MLRNFWVAESASSAAGPTHGSSAAVAPSLQPPGARGVSRVVPVTPRCQVWPGPEQWGREGGVTVAVNPSEE